MNLVYGLSFHEFSVAQVDSALANFLGGHKVRILSGTQIFSLSHVRDMLINSRSQFLFPSPILTSNGLNSLHETIMCKPLQT